jgi:hypothetical protein
MPYAQTFLPRRYQLATALARFAPYGSRGRKSA